MSEPNGDSPSLVDEENDHAREQSKRESWRRRAGRATVRVANVFVPIATSKVVLSDGKRSLSRIGVAVGLLIGTLRDAWCKMRAGPSEVDLGEARANLEEMDPELRARVMSTAQIHWWLGVVMMLIGLAVAAYGLFVVVLGVMATVGHALAGVLWCGFGVVYAVRATADYHAVCLRKPISGVQVFRDRALWVPYSTTKR